MTTTMSLAARREMSLSIRQRYLSVKRPEKPKLLDEFVPAAGRNVSTLFEPAVYKLNCFFYELG